MKIEWRGIGAATAVLGVFLPSVCFGQQEMARRRLGLQKALRMALVRQPDLATTLAESNAARQRLIQARSSFFPSVSLQYTHSDKAATGNGVGNTFDGTTGQIVKSNTLNTVNRNGDLVVSYQVFDSGQRVANEQQARASAGAASLAAQDQRQTVLANVATEYYAVLRSRALVEVEKASVQRAQTTLEMVRAQVGSGASAAKDIYQAEADLENARVSLIQAQNEAEIAETQLKQAIGLSDEEGLDPIDDVSGTALDGSPTPNLAELKQRAYQTRPDVLQAVANVERDKAGVRYARALNGPTLGVDVSLAGVFAPNSSASRTVGLTASLPVFNAGANRAAVREAEETLKATESRLASKKLGVATEVAQAYRNLLTARATVPAAAAAQKAAQVNYDSASAARREGIGTVVDVINAQSQLVQAQISYVQAIYDLRTAAIQLQRAVGQADRLVADSTGGIR